MSDAGQRAPRRLLVFAMASLCACIFMVGTGAYEVSAEMALYPTLSGQAPLIIGHRGASGYRPEHTLESYAKAIELGADFIEPDLVSTKDGVLIARHEPWLGDTTDVGDHPEFADRRKTQIVDGHEVDDWFASEFTLVEIKQLRARQAFSMRDQSFNGMFEIPTFDEIVLLAISEGAKRNRVVGIYPETKHPTFHYEIGLPLEDILLERLAQEGWTEKDSPLIVQSFEVANLRYIRTKSNIRLVQLIAGPETRPYDFVTAGRPTTYLDLLRPEGLDEIRTYADGIGIPKEYVVLNDPKSGWSGEDLIPSAHRRQLFVHAYTFRNEERFRLADFGASAANEYEGFYRMGTDGIFSDFPDTAREAMLSH
jgi:glycerophosphoryl diester phosphodiesterase